MKAICKMNREKKNILGDFETFESSKTDVIFRTNTANASISLLFFFVVSISNSVRKVVIVCWEQTTNDTSRTNSLKIEIKKEFGG